MLGVTTYEEALRALGGDIERERGSAGDEDAALPSRVLVAEDPRRAAVTVALEQSARTLTAADLMQALLASRARRGEGAAAGPVSDLLRAVGYALDDLSAYEVRIDLRPHGLVVNFCTPSTGGVQHELSYAADEMAALRQSAANRRKGNPLRRVLILHQEAQAAAPTRELLLAEFAVEARPRIYATAVATAGHTPHLVIVHLGDDGCEAALEAVRTLRGGQMTAGLPVLAVAGPGCPLDPDRAFAAGADDFLPEPMAAALLRARVRTWILRGNGSR